MSRRGTIIAIFLAIVVAGIAAFVIPSYMARSGLEKLIATLPQGTS